MAQVGSSFISRFRMQIGYVDRKGYLKAGIGNVGEKKFDSECNLVAKNDEEWVNKGKLELSLNRQEGRFTSKAIVERGKGTLYVTHKRLVFLLEPTYYRAAQDLIPLSLPYGMKRMREAKELKKRGWKEFLEIDVSEITEVRAYLGRVGMTLRGNRLPTDRGRVKYWAALFPKKKAVALLGDLARN